MVIPIICLSVTIYLATIVGFSYGEDPSHHTKPDTNTHSASMVRMVSNCLPLLSQTSGRNWLSQVCKVIFLSSLDAQVSVLCTTNSQSHHCLSSSLIESTVTVFAGLFLSVSIFPC